MKKIIFTLALLAFASSSFAASSQTWQLYETNGAKFVQVAVTYICHTDGSFTTAVFKNSNNQTADLAGYYLYYFVHDVGATGPTADSDLYVREHSATGIDRLGGAGVNFLDNADATPLASSQPWINGAEAPVPIYGPLYLVISNNSVNGATGTIWFMFIKEE